MEKGLPVLLTGVIIYIAGLMLQDRLKINDYTSVIMLSAVVFWVGSFVTAYGTSAFRLARFPLLFLVFMIPVPNFIMDRIIHVLQAGSTEVTELLFALTGIFLISNESSLDP